MNRIIKLFSLAAPALAYLLMTAGTYTIFVQPSYAATGSFQLSRP